MLTPWTLLNILHREDAQNSVEYMLVIGAVAVAIVAALILAFPEVVRAIAGLACESIDTASFPTPASWGSCLV